MTRRSEYKPLDKEDVESVSDGEDLEHTRVPRSTSSRIIRLLLASNALSLFIIISLALFIWKPEHFPFALNYTLKRTSFYTPLLDIIDIPVEVVQHDNTIFAHSEYAQPPSPEVDEIWGNLAHPRFLLVDDDTVRRVGKDPELTVQHPEKPGKHIAYLAVHHQLHCLNDLRRNIFADYYFPNGIPNGTHVDHVQHCIDLIRQTILCNANLDLITYNWWELTDNPQPDFHVNMKCRNWDAIDKHLARPFEETGIFKWYEEGWMDGWQRQGGEKNVTIDKGWWEIALDGGLVTSDEFDTRWGGS